MEIDIHHCKQLTQREVGISLSRVFFLLFHYGLLKIVPSLVSVSPDNALPPLRASIVGGVVEEESRGEELDYDSEEDDFSEEDDCLLFLDQLWMEEREDICGGCSFV